MFKLSPRLLGLIALCLMLTGLHAESGYATVHRVVGEATFERPGDERIYKLERGLMLPEGSRIKTGSNARALLKLTSGSAIRVAQNSNLVIKLVDEKDEQDKKVLVKLDRGTISSLIKAKEKGKTDFRIQTPQGSAAARGTFFAVNVSEDQKTYVKVKEGLVELFRQ